MCPHVPRLPTGPDFRGRVEKQAQGEEWRENLLLKLTGIIQIHH